MTPEECVQRLESLTAQIDGINELFDDNGRVDISDRRFAQVLLRKLKEEVGTESHRLSLVRTQTTLSEVEKAYYDPAVGEANAAIRIRWNSVPRRQWQHELYDARISIDFYADMLRKQLGEGNG